MERLRKNYGRPFVRAREELYEAKLEAAKLRENLVHEEYHLGVAAVYDFRCDTRCPVLRATARPPLKCLLCLSALRRTSIDINTAVLQFDEIARHCCLQRLRNSTAALWRVLEKLLRRVLCQAGLGVDLCYSRTAVVVTKHPLRSAEGQFKELSKPKVLIRGIRFNISLQLYSTMLCK